MAALGEAEYGTDADRPLVRWAHRNGSRRIDAAALRADHPDIAAKYTVVGEPTRVFTILGEDE